MRNDGGGAGDGSKLQCFGCAGQVVALVPITWLAERRCVSGGRVKLSKSGPEFAEIG